MGQKVNSNGLRYGIYKEWQSRWIASSDKLTAQWLVQDDKIRNLLVSKKYKNAIVDKVEIERVQNKINLFIYAGQTPLLLDETGKAKKELILEIHKIIGRNIKINANVLPIVNPNVCAKIIAREIADAIEKRVSFRNAQKQALRKVLKSGAKGVKTHVAGRLGGVEMARSEGYSQGNIPLSTLRSDVDYALELAHTQYGIIGVKVWINRGIIFKKGEISEVCLKAPVQSWNSKPNYRGRNKNNNRPAINKE